MKLLKVESSCGYFRLQDGSYSPVDKISKDDLLWLVSVTLSDEDVEFDIYDESMIQNHAHQVIYKSIVRKLHSLRERKQEFVDESARLYLEDYEKYKMVPAS
ncbi:MULTISPECIES: hypothetical protein [Pseudomonas]|uniref:hypothetical protein n=1 Tax=Pseudomonas TaxID=286 RepID=UPI0018E80CD0|nr:MULTISPECIES: hypothetical protein [Pseudomonas]MBJ2346187.1 hypothetical protein [Pseudomonas canavaninivorans]MBL3544260.1 hypothetical protein [Pseudomonas sp. HB05]